MYKRQAQQPGAPAPRKEATPDVEVERLIADLGSPESREEALIELRRMRRKALPALKVLLQLINDPDGLSVAHPALWALCSIGPDAVKQRRLRADPPMRVLEPRVFHFGCAKRTSGGPPAGVSETR